MRKVVRTDAEVDELLNALADASDEGHELFPGKTYEEGVEAGIQWLLGDRDDHPYDVGEGGEDGDG